MVTGWHSSRVSLSPRDSYCTEKSSSQKPEIRELQICRKKRRLWEAQTSGETLFTSALVLKSKGRLSSIYWAIDSKKKKKRMHLCAQHCALNSIKMSIQTWQDFIRPQRTQPQREQPWKAFSFLLSCHLTITVCHIKDNMPQFYSPLNFTPLSLLQLRKMQGAGSQVQLENQPPSQEILPRERAPGLLTILEKSALTTS